MTLSDLERLAREARIKHPGPWSIDGEGDRVDYIRATLPEPLPDYVALGDRRDLPIVLETDSGVYEPKGALARFIAALDPDTVLALVQLARAVQDWSKIRHRGAADDDRLYQALAALNLKDET